MRIGHTFFALAGCGVTLALGLGPVSAYTVTDVRDGATIRAVVTFSGDVAVPEVYYMQKNPRVCGQAPDAMDGARSVSFVRTSNGSLEDILVFLEGVDKGKPFPSDMSKFATFLSQWCTWKPRVGVFVNGDPITVTNLDPVVHNPIGYETVGPARLNHFNIPLHVQGDTFHQPVMLRKGQFLKLECLQHQFMHSWVFRITNPYFAISRFTGTLEIGGIPPGDYTLNAWHPTLGIQRRQVTLASNQALEVQFEYH